MSITCVLNVYVRPQYLQEQLNAISNQTIKAKNIIIWNNNPSINLSEYNNKENIIVFNSSKNLGVWARFFSMYYLFGTEYVCIFDDDTIPNNGWFENCVNTINKYNALLGTIGVYFNISNEYSVNKRYGWDGPCDDIKIVDIVGHSWFFKTKWIETIIKELPNIQEQMLTCGEDIHLSYILSKYLFIPTVVPPHPQNNTISWGADKYKSILYGGGSDSTFIKTGIAKFSEALNSYKSKGFEITLEKEKYIKVYDNCLDYFLNKIIKNENFALMRFADGEHSILINNTLTNIDKWTFKTNSILCEHLNESLKLINTNVFYGISGPCDNKDIYDFYWKNIANKNNITFANVFVNANYKKWIDFINSYNGECFLIASSMPKENKIGNIKIINSLLIDEFLVNDWDAKYDHYFNILNKISLTYKNTMFLVAAGPISEIFIYKMYLNNPHNIYIDIGSSLDPIIKNKISRDYQIKDFNSNYKNIQSVV